MTTGADDTRRYLDAVFGETVGWAFVAFGTDHKVTDTGKVEHGSWRESALRWPAEADQIVEAICDGVAAGADVYVTPSLSANPVRKISTAKGRKPLPVSTLWADLDQIDHPERVDLLIAHGAWRVRSGTAGRCHLYIPVVDPIDPDHAGELLDRLADWLGADPAVARHGAYLRPVGAYNLKAPTLQTGPATLVEFIDTPTTPTLCASHLDDLLPPLRLNRVTSDGDLPEPIDVDDIPEALAAIIGEPVTDGMDRSERTMRAALAIREHWCRPGEAVTLLRRHAPTVDKYDDRPGRLDREIARVIGKLWKHDPPQPEAEPLDLADAHQVVRRWLGAEYDLDAFDVVLAAAAAERLDGDPLWLLVISGSGNAKTETVQALAGAGAHVISTIQSAGALLSASPKKERTVESTGGLLRKIGDRGVLVIKDVTSILSMDRNGRAEVLAALREVYDGRWVRNVGTDGGRTLEWCGRIAVVGAVTTAWDTAHAVVAAMGDRFVLLRLDSTQGRLAAGRRSIENTGHEIEMRAALADAAAGVLATVDPAADYTLTSEEQDALLAAADLVTLARTAVERDYRGDVIDAHQPEMPTRFAKQLAQVMRGALAIGKGRPDALRLALRTARDSMPPLRLAILLDVAAHPHSTPTDTRRRLGRPRATVDRELQALHSIGLVECDEVSAGQGERTRWHYTLADAVDVVTLAQMSSPRFVGNGTQGHEKREESETLTVTHISGNDVASSTSTVFGDDESMI